MLVAADAWPIVGREADVAILAAALERGRGLVVAGEAGVGKTRLVRTVLDELTARGWSTSSFAGGVATKAVPFLTFASLRPTASEGLDRLVQAADALVATGERVAVAVDDAHQLDDVSLAFLSHLLVATDVRILLTVRTGEADPAVLRGWTDILQRVDVGPLDRAAVDDLVTTVLGGEVDPAARTWVWETTQGNALFVRELVVDAVERQLLAEQGGRWVLAAAARPPGDRLQEVVAARVGALADDERAAVELLALGEPLGVTLVESLVGADALRSLERRALVAADRSRKRAEVRLAHPIHGEVVRELLGSSTARGHLLALIDAIQATGARRRFDTLRVALWRLELGDVTDPDGLLAAAEDLEVLTDQAVSTELQSSGDFRMVSGPRTLDRAAQLARAALDAGGGLRAAVALFTLLSRLGRHDEAAALHPVLDELTVTDADRVSVASRLSDTEALILGDPRRAMERLLRLEAAVSDPSLQRTLAARRVGLLLVTGSLDDALSLGTSLLADDATTRPDRVQVAGALAGALAVRGRTEDALRLLDAAAAEAVDGDVGTLAVILVPRLGALAYAGRIEELEMLATACHAMADQFGSDDGRAMFAVILASVALLRGRPVTARGHVDEALKLMRDVDPFGMRLLALATRAHAEALTGRVDAAAAAIAEIDAEGTFPDDVTRARAAVLVASRRVGDAVELLLAAADIATDSGRFVGAVGLLYDVARLGGAGRVAERIAALAVDIDGQIVPAQAAHVAALVAGDADAVDAASAALAATGAALYAAEAAAQAAALHRAAGRKAAAASSAQTSTALLAECEGARTPALAGSEPLAALTKREREVVQLAAQGRSDREIADELVVSVRTVETHLYNAYAKLGVEGREGLAGLY